MKRIQFCALSASVAVGFVLTLGVILSQATPDATPHSLNTAQHFLPSLANPRDRFGFDSGPLAGYDVTQLNAGWYSNWGASLNPAHPDRLNYVQLIKLHAGADPHDPAQVRITPGKQTIADIIAANPGSLWLIGNEPDSLYQGDPIHPEVYAIVYHNLYTYIKELDPYAHVANGGIVQPTPCRLEYLDIVWNTYLDTYGQPMPVDMWNIHAFILREVYGSWGASTPPGVDPSCAIDYAVNDADDMEIFRENLRAMRGWMKDKGYQDKPLIISEYGILWPEWFAPQFDAVRVSRFMTRTFDLFLYESHVDVGYPADGHRLVQAWAWYSLDDDYYNGALFNQGDQTITAIGRNYATYTRSLSDTPYVDLSAWLIAGSPVPLGVARAGSELTFSVPITAYVGNLGKVDSPDTLVRFELFSEQGGSVLLGWDEVHDVPSRFNGVVPMSLFTLSLPTSGLHELRLTADPDAQVDEPREWNNVVSVTLDFRPDWVPLSLTHRLVASTVQSGTLVLTATVRNQGNRSSPEVSATFYLQDLGQGTVLPASPWITVSVPALDLGTQVTLVNSATHGSLGLYALSLVIDPASSTAETDEENNTITATLDLRPDLVPLDLSYRLSGSPIQSGTLTLTATLVNQGKWSSPAASATAYLETVPGGTLLPPQVLQVPSLTIGAQASVTVDLAWPAPEHDLYRLVLEVDRADRLPEVSEENNVVELLVPVTLRVNLNPTMSTVLTSASGAVQLVFPANWVTEPLQIAFTPLWPPDWVAGSVRSSAVGFSLTAWRDDRPAEVDSGLPFSVTWCYGDEDLSGLDEAGLRLFGRRPSGAWDDAACGPYQRDFEGQRLTVDVCRLGALVFGDRYLRHVPLILRNLEAVGAWAAPGLSEEGWIGPNSPLLLPFKPGDGR